MFRKYIRNGSDKMKYIKPIVVENEEFSEGIYAASGAENSDCWTVTPVSVQDWNGSHHIFEIYCVHSNAVEHISSATTVTLSFDQPVNDAYSEFPCTFSGNTVTITRELHANAYKSGDTMTYKVWIQGVDEAATKGMVCVGTAIKCNKTVNVQGNY